MWVFNTDGFFSVVKDAYCPEGHVVVRARKKQDLIALAKRARIKTKITELDHADYRYRLYMKQDKWVSYLQDAAQAINYSNFKAAVGGDMERRLAYHRCWESLTMWQSTR